MNGYWECGSLFGIFDKANTTNFCPLKNEQYMSIQIKIIFKVYRCIGYVNDSFDFENDTSFLRLQILDRNTHLLIKDAFTVTPRRVLHTAEVSNSGRQGAYGAAQPARTFGFAPNGNRKKWKWAFPNLGHSLEGNVSRNTSAKPNRFIPRSGRLATIRRTLSKNHQKALRPKVTVARSALSQPTAARTSGGRRQSAGSRRLPGPLRGHATTAACGSHADGDDLYSGLVSTMSS